MNPTPKPIRCWAVYDDLLDYRERITEIKPAPEKGYTIIPGRFVPDKPKNRKRK